MLLVTRYKFRKITNDFSQYKVWPRVFRQNINCLKSNAISLEEIHYEHIMNKGLCTLEMRIGVLPIWFWILNVWIENVGFLMDINTCLRKFEVCCFWWNRCEYGNLNVWIERIVCERVYCSNMCFGEVKKNLG